MASSESGDASGKATSAIVIVNEIEARNRGGKGGAVMHDSVKVLRWDAPDGQSAYEALRTLIETCEPAPVDNAIRHPATDDRLSAVRGALDGAEVVRAGRDVDLVARAIALADTDGLPLLDLTRPMPLLLRGDAAGHRLVRPADAAIQVRRSGRVKERDGELRITGGRGMWLIALLSPLVSALIAVLSVPMMAAGGSSAATAVVAIAVPAVVGIALGIANVFGFNRHVLSVRDGKLWRAKGWATPVVWCDVADVTATFAMLDPVRLIVYARHREPLVLSFSNMAFPDTAIHVREALDARL